MITPVLYAATYSLALGALLLGLWLPGYGLLRLFRLHRDEPYDRLGELCLGSVFWISGLFVLATVGELHRSGVLLLQIAAATLAGAGIAKAGRPASRAPRSERSAGLRQGLPRLLFLAAFLAPIFLLAASPQVSWDADVYHLTLPRLYLEAEGFRPVAISVYSNWPLGVEMLFALAMLAKDYVLAKLLHFAFGLGVLWALALACRRIGRAAAGWLAGLLFLANPVVIYELRVAYVDLAHALFLTLCLLFMDRALTAEGDDHRGWLLLSGLAGGLAAGVKITGIAGTAAVGALYLPRLVRAGRRGALARALGPFLARFAAPCLALLLPWLAKAAAFTGNPVYPFLGGLFPTPDWSPELGRRFAEWQSSIGMGREVVDYLLLPFRVILEGGRGYEHFDGELGSFWILLLPLALVFGRRIPLARRALAVAGLYFCFWAATSQQVRFLVPVLPALALAAALALEEVLHYLRESWREAMRWALWVGAALLLLTPNLPLLASGARLVRIYGLEAEELRASVVPPVCRFVGEELPAEAKILMLNTNRAFFCRREILADSFFEASQIAEWLRGDGREIDAAGLRQKLAGRGITHVLMENRDWGIAYPRALGVLLRDSAAARLVFRSEDGRHFLWELL